MEENTMQNIISYTNTNIIVHVLNRDMCYIMHCRIRYCSFSYGLEENTQTQHLMQTFCCVLLHELCGRPCILCILPVIRIPAAAVQQIM